MSIRVVSPLGDEILPANIKENARRKRPRCSLLNRLLRACCGVEWGEGESVVRLASC